MRARVKLRGLSSVIGGSLERIKELENTGKELFEKHKELSEKHLDNRSLIESLEDEIISLRNKKTFIEKIIDRVKPVTEDSATRIKRLEEKNRELLKNIESIESRHGNLLKEHLDSRLLIDDSRLLIDDKDIKIKQLEGEINKLKSQKTTGQKIVDRLKIVFSGRKAKAIV